MSQRHAASYIERARGGNFSSVTNIGLVAVALASLVVHSEKVGGPHFFIGSFVLRFSTGCKKKKNEQNVNVESFEVPNFSSLAALNLAHLSTAMRVQM